MGWHNKQNPELWGDQSDQSEQKLSTVMLMLQADAQHDELKKQNAELENKLESLRKDVRLT